MVAQPNKLGLFSLKQCSLKQRILRQLSLTRLSFLLVVLELGFTAQLSVADTADLFNLSLEELLAVPVVTATRHEETLLSVPSSTTVFHRKEIQRMGITHLTELMNFVPGFQSYRSDYSASQWLFSSRNRRSGAASREVLILIDGVRMNDDWAGGNFHDIYFTLENAERVEFIRGPGSALYGSNAFLGVINIITTQKTRNVAAFTGNHTRARGVSNWYWQGEQQNKVAVFVEHESSKGDLLTVVDPNPADEPVLNLRDGYTQSTFYASGQVSDFSFNARYYQYNNQEFYASSRILGADSDYALNTLSVSGQYKFTMSAQWEGSARLSYADRRQHTKGLIDKLEAVEVFANVDERELGGLVQLNYSDGKKNKALFGMEVRQPNHYRNNGYIARNSGSLDNVSYAPQGTRTISAVFAQYQYRLYERWEAIAGARVDHYSDVGEKLSPRGGLLFHYNDRNTFKLLGGQAFRAPTWNETGAQNNPLIQGNQSLKPEVATTVELVWLHLTNFGHYQVTLYDVEIADAIVEVPDSLQRLNLDEESISGVELEAHQQLFEHFSLHSTATWVVNPPSDISTESDILLSTSVVYARENMSISLNMYHQGAKQDPHAAELSETGYTEFSSTHPFSANFQYQLTPDIELLITAKNMGNKNYFSPAENTANIVGVPNRGRSVEMGVRVTF